MFVWAKAPTTKAVSWSQSRVSVDLSRACDLILGTTSKVVAAAEIYPDD